MNPESESNARPRDKRTAIGLAIAAILMAGVAYGIFQIVKGVSAGSRDALAVSDHFLELLKKHDFSSASDLFANEAKTVNMPTDLAKIQSLIEDHQGKDIQYGTPTWQYNVNNGVSSVTVLYPLESSNSAGSITVVVVETTYGWQIYSYNFSFH